MAIDYETQLNKIKEAQKQSAIADLENTRNQTLSDLQAERESNQRNYAAQRNQANIQNQIQAKNFKEYLVNSGRANSGIMPQYEMNRQNNLQRSLNDLGAAENVALADINRRNTLANQSYNTGLQSANANIEANYLNNLLQQQQAAWQREMEQKKFDESVRQYNENLAWQKQQYADQLARQSVASSGRSYSSGGSSKTSTSNSSGGISSYGTNLLNSLSKQLGSKNLGVAVAAVPNAIASINNAYQSGQITADEVKYITSKLGLN